MILIGLGANLPSRFGPPSATLATALDQLARRGVRVVRRSRWYTSPPEPVSDQPWYTNGVALVETTLSPEELLAALLDVEQALGRERVADRKNTPRTVDLDLLAYGDRVHGAGSELVLPHPRMHARAFVLHPLAEVAPGWVHPTTGRTVEELIAALPPNARALPVG
ncbi:MAG: 2-amino-4-hydroxy-6-hydroxymethyldihydropteridine diphosphokinase [Alphaproteobacteria bacterium]|nr:2-amino-4-hydroxy-6-hydroxymethyldihydropteridine diphosphokinase [Alphaproteobacteria bacterium]